MSLIIKVDEDGTTSVSVGGLQIDGIHSIELRTDVDVCPVPCIRIVLEDVVGESPLARRAQHNFRKMLGSHSLIRVATHRAKLEVK
jgi:hypothetical protein